MNDERMSKPVSVAAAEHLAAVEAERDAMRAENDRLWASLMALSDAAERAGSAVIAENARLRAELEAVQPIIDAAQAVVDWWTDPTETTAADLFPALHAALAAAREAQP